MIDRARIHVKAGDGGDGAVSFRREKYVPYGGPDGGDGGNGGSIVIQADHNVTTLADFQHKKIFKADRGENGRGKKMHGKTSVDLIIKVPVGTLIKDDKTEKLLVDLIEHDQAIIIARGGVGGYGNIHFVSSTNKAPYIAQKGEIGEEKDLLLDLKLLADVGIIGLPNSGKSTLLGSISHAKPKIGNYQFTTLEPNLGVVSNKGKSFIVADIPGIIEGAHLGRGLGHDFLRHIERTRVLVYLLDGSSEDPKLDMKQLKKEMRLYSKELIGKSYIVVVNKIDIPEVSEKIKSIKKQFRLEKSLTFISAITGDGLSKLLDSITEMLSVEKIKETTPVKAEEEFKVFYPVPVGSKFEVKKQGNVFILTGEGVERVAAMVDYDAYESRPVIMKQLARMGAARALKRAGLKTGDTIKMGEIELVWTEK